MGDSRAAGGSGPPDDAPENESPSPSPSPPAAAAGRIAVVLNGNAKSVTREIVALLDQIVLGGDLYVSRSLEEGAEIARGIIARGYGTVLTGGGDGTFVYTVTHVVREARARGVKPPRFGMLRLGTGNALAWVVGSSPLRKGMGIAADIARLRAEGGCREVRLVDVDGTLSPFAGAGIDATVLAEYIATKRFFARTPVLKRFAAGSGAYFAAIVGRTMPKYLFTSHPRAEIYNDGATAFRLGPDGRMVGAPVERGEKLYTGEARMVAVSTIPFYGFGFRIFPFAAERADRMSLRVVNIGPQQVPANIVKIWKGTYRDPERVFDFLVERVRVRFDRPVPIQIGGDPGGERQEFVVSLSEPIEMVDFYAPTPLLKDEALGPRGED
jgi:diacylglycerol kinase family enzyme